MKTLLSYSQNIKILSATLCLMIIFNYPLLAQNDGGVAIGDTLRTPDPSAILELFSEKKGFLPPRMTAAQIDSISEPAEGLIVYDTDNKRLLYYYEGWKDIGHWRLFEEDETKYIEHAGPVIIMDSTTEIEVFSEGHLLYVLGKKGIFSSVTGDSVPDEFYTANGFNVVFENNETGVFNTVMNTQSEGEGNTSGLTLYTSGAGEMTGGLNTEASYTGDGAGMVAGLISNAWVEDTEAEVLAVGGVLYSKSEHSGINIGTRIEAAGEDTRANFAAIIAANAPEEGSPFMDSIASRFPERVTIATLTHNEASDSIDFNIYASGSAKNYFEGNVGIGKVNPQTKLDIAGAVNASSYWVNGNPLAINNAWSESGDDIYYSTGNVHVGKLMPGSRSNFNVVGQMLVATDTSFSLPLVGFAVKKDTVQTGGGSIFNSPGTGISMGIFDTVSRSSGLDTAILGFGMTTGQDGLTSNWTYFSDSLFNMISLTGFDPDDEDDKGIVMLSAKGLEIESSSTPKSLFQVHPLGIQFYNNAVTAVSTMNILDGTTKIGNGTAQKKTEYYADSTKFNLTVFDIPETDTVNFTFTKTGLGVNTDSPDTELHVNGNIKQMVYEESISNPPTETELDGLFTSPASKGNGWTVYVKDDNSDNMYQIMAWDDEWYIISTLKAQ